MCRRKFPGETIIRRVLSSTDAGKLDKITGKWLADHAGKGDGGGLAIVFDRKVLCGAWTTGNDQVTLFSAMIQREGTITAQVRVPDDITRSPRMPSGWTSCPFWMTFRFSSSLIPRIPRGRLRPRTRKGLNDTTR